MTMLIDTPRSYFYTYINQLLDGIKRDSSPAEKKALLKSIIKFLDENSRNPKNFADLVNFQFNWREDPILIPLWLYISFKMEYLYKNQRTLEAREKKLKPILDKFLNIVMLDFKSPQGWSATALAGRFGYWYTAYRLASVDPFAAGDKDMILQYCSSILNRDKKLRVMTILVMEQIPDIEEKINNQTADSGRTALHYACAYSNPEIVEWLIAKGIEVNRQDVAGHTPLWHCISGVELGIQHGEFRTGAQVIMEYLLAHGADPHIPNHKGKYFIDHLKKNYRNDERIVQMIMAMPKPESDSAEPTVAVKSVGLVKAIADDVVHNHDPELLEKGYEEIVLSLLTLFQRLAVIEFYPKDVMEILSRRKRLYNNKFDKNSQNRISISYKSKEIIRQIVNISLREDSLVTINPTTQRCCVKA